MSAGTFASLMIAAAVNAKALSTYMGHTSITITLDRYGHLMPGNEGEAAELLDRYLEKARLVVGEHEDERLGSGWQCAAYGKTNEHAVGGEVCERASSNTRVARPSRAKTRSAA